METGIRNFKSISNACFARNYSVLS